MTPNTRMSGRFDIHITPRPTATRPRSIGAIGSRLRSVQYEHAYFAASYSPSSAATTITTTSHHRTGKRRNATIATPTNRSGTRTSSNVMVRLAWAKDSSRKQVAGLKQPGRQVSAFMSNTGNPNCAGFSPPVTSAFQ